MNTTTIKVQYVNDPKPGKKMGSVKTESGQYYSVKPEMLPQFSQGGEYEVEFSSRDWQGKNYLTIEKIVGSAPQSPQNAPRWADTGEVVPRPPNDVRSGRIERQHSQEMALRLFALIGGLQADDKDMMKKLRSTTDWFQRDIGHDPTKSVDEEDEVF